jgi:hypothetical protein
MKLITLLIVISSLFSIFYTRKADKVGNKKSKSKPVISKSDNRGSKPKSQEAVILRQPTKERIENERPEKMEVSMMGKNFY